MHRLLPIFGLLILACCSVKQKTTEEFTESDAYEVINLFIAEKLTNEKDEEIYWAAPIIKAPIIDSSYYGEYLFPQVTPFYSLTKENWDTTKIKGVAFVSGKEYEYFFDKNRTSEKDEEWDDKYDGKFLHCVSFPKLIPKTKTIVIKHHLTRPYIYCGTGLSHEFFYTKTDKGWQEK